MDYGLIGEKLGHSYSVPIHNKLGLENYILQPLAPEELGPFLEKRAFKGVNVTIPYKQAVMPYCDFISDEARKIGSVNTLIVAPDGALRGYNTDYQGFAAMAEAAGVSFAGKKAAILGSGGTSHTARAVIADAGAREILIVSRRGPCTYEDLYDHTDLDILVNTTPVGMYPHNGAAPVDLGRFPHVSGVLDVIYNPLKTALILDAEARGIPCAGGLWMLVIQAAAAQEYFLGRPWDAAAAERVYREMCGEVANVILIGMPGSGKTTIGRAVASEMGRTFVDLDAEAAARAGMSIPELFAAQGEGAFRALESRLAQEYGREKALVIACGGGVVLREENYAPLAQNGRIYQICRGVDALAMGGRPLSASRDALRAMEEARAPLYARFADVQVENSGSAADAAAKIVEEFYAYFCH